MQKKHTQNKTKNNNLCECLSAHSCLLSAVINLFIVFLISSLFSFPSVRRSRMVLTQSAAGRQIHSAVMLMLLLSSGLGKSLPSSVTLIFQCQQKSNCRLRRKETIGSSQDDVCTQVSSE